MLELIREIEYRCAKSLKKTQIIIEPFGTSLTGALKFCSKFLLKKSLGKKLKVTRANVIVSFSAIWTDFFEKMAIFLHINLMINFWYQIAAF
jgi:hypothetical protein